MSEYIFVYGTLLPERAPDDVSALVKSLRFVGHGEVPGRLYDLGEYSGAILDPCAETRIAGVVFMLPDDPAVITALDDCEGFESEDQASSLFTRRQVLVSLQDGQVQRCWVYEYNRDPGAAPLIDDGDFRRHRVA